MDQSVVLERCKGVCARVVSEFNGSECLARAQKKVGELKAQMEESVHTARDKPKDAAEVVGAQQSDMQICLPSAAGIDHFNLQFLETEFFKKLK